MTLKEVCVRSYQSQGEGIPLADYHFYALVGYYLVRYPGAEMEQLRRDMSEDLIRPEVGASVLRLIRSGIK